MKIRSKIITGLGAYFVISMLYTLVTAAGGLTEMGGGQLALWLFSFVSTIAVGIGLLMYKRWAMWLYFITTPVALASSLTAPSIDALEPSKRLAAQTFVILILLVPALLIWIRRDRLSATGEGSAHA